MTGLADCTRRQQKKDDLLENYTSQRKFLFLCLFKSHAVSLNMKAFLPLLIFVIPLPLKSKRDRQFRNVQVHILVF